MSLFDDFAGVAKTYYGVTEVMPEIDQFLRLESSLKGVNLQLSRTTRDMEKLRGGIAKGAVSFGLSTERMLEATEASTRYGKMLSGSTLAAVTMFADAMDESTYAVGEFTSKLISSRRIEEKETEKLLKNILAYREQYGLATEDLRYLYDITEKYANIVGVTGDNLVRATGSISKFISALKQVGVEAYTSGDLIDRLINPETIQDNILLITKLGLSMEDVMFGDPMEKLEQSLPRLKRLGQEVVAIPSRVAASNIAQMYGFTLEEMRRFSEIEINQRDINSEKTMAQYKMESQTALDTFENIKNTLFGGVSSIFNMLVGFAKPLENILVEPLRQVFGPQSIILIGAGISLVMYKTLGIATKRFKKIFISTAKLFGSAMGEEIGEGIRASLTSKLRTFSDTGGLKEGLVESEKRTQEHETMFSRYSKIAEGQPASAYDAMGDFISTTRGTPLKRVEAERIRQMKEFEILNSESSQKNYINIIAQAVEEREAKIIEIEKAQKEIEALQSNNQITKDMAEVMISGYSSQITELKIQTDKILESEAGKAFLFNIYEDEHSRYISAAEAYKKSNEKLDELEKILNFHKKKNDLAKINETESAITLLKTRMAEEESTLAKHSIDVQRLNEALYTERLMEKERDILGLEETIIRKKHERYKAETTKERIDELEKEIKEDEKKLGKRKEWLAKEKKLIADKIKIGTASSLNKNAEDIIKEQSGNVDKKTLGLAVSNLFGLGGSTSKLSMFFAKAGTGFKAPLGVGMKIPQTALSALVPAGIIAGVGATMLVGFLKKNEKFNEELKRAEELKNKALTWISNIISKPFTDGLKFVNDKLESIDKSLDKSSSSTERVTDDLSKYIESSLINTRNSEEMLLKGIEQLNANMSKVAGFTEQSADATSATALELKRQRV